ncbi:hypothetical protein [Microbulbifer zhoushanensis]|uniref:hypothetical protein n=1 Tax=Microbulbifer TaxID=48073 RepID=UPI001F2A7E6F|nr:hypothetical protein [Microbulbifer zhoushanensis]
MMDRVKISEVAFRVSQAYFNAYASVSGKVDSSCLDLDSSVHFEITSVPDQFDFYSDSKRFRNEKLRIKELNKFLCFLTPEGLNIAELHEGKAVGFEAAKTKLAEYGIDSAISWSFRY